jgi:hypothetical protein
MVLEDNSIGLPALSIPVENKDEFSCPPEHVEVLRSCIKNVTKIVTIGWRATERDFLQLLRESLPESSPDLMVVSGSAEGADETCDNLGILNEQIQDDHYLPIDTGFQWFNQQSCPAGDFSSALKQHKRASYWRWRAIGCRRKAVYYEISSETKRCETGWHW